MDLSYTSSGIAKRLKEHNPQIEIIGVDPVGSILAEPDSLNDENRLESYLVEGIGYDFIPAVCNRKLVDRWMKSNDKDSLGKYTLMGICTDDLHLC